MSNFQDLGLASSVATGRARLNFIFWLFQSLLQPVNGVNQVQWSKGKFSLPTCYFLLTSRFVIQPIKILCVQR